MSLHNLVLSLLLHIKESQLWTYRQHFAILQRRTSGFSETQSPFLLLDCTGGQGCLFVTGIFNWSTHFLLCPLLLYEETSSLSYGGIPSVFLLCNPCRFFLYLINSVASAKGNIGKSRICKNFAGADHSWNTACVPVHNLGCYNRVGGVDCHSFNSYWKAEVIALMGFDNTHFCRIIVFGSSVSCSVSMTN